MEYLQTEVLPKRVWLCLLSIALLITAMQKSMWRSGFVPAIHRVGLHTQLFIFFVGAASDII